MSALPIRRSAPRRHREAPQGLLYPHQADGVVFTMSKGRWKFSPTTWALGRRARAIVAMRIAAPDGADPGGLPGIVEAPTGARSPARRSRNVNRGDRRQSGSARRRASAALGYRQLRSTQGPPQTGFISIDWAGVILDEAHFIENNSQRTSHVPEAAGRCPTMPMRR